jgi:hypothetical protein
MAPTANDNAAATAAIKRAYGVAADMDDIADTSPLLSGAKSHSEYAVFQ